MKLTLIFYHKIKRMAAPWGIIITEESGHTKPYLQVDDSVPWWNMNIDPTSIITTSYITSIATYHNSSAVGTAKFYRCRALCSHLYSSAHTVQGNTSNFLWKTETERRHATQEGAEQRILLESAAAWIPVPALFHWSCVSSGRLPFLRFPHL